MYKIIGFEGSKNPVDGVTWGAAALLVDGKIVNAVSKADCDVSIIEKPDAEIGFTKLPRSIDVVSNWEDRPIVVVRFPIDKANKSLFKAFREDSIGEVEDGDVCYVAHLDKTSFKTHAREVIDVMLKQILFQNWTNGDYIERLFRIMMTLDYTHPALNAIWAFHQQKPFIEKLARAQVRANEKEQFDELLTRCKETAVDLVEFDFTGGEAETGGFSLPVSGSLLSSLDNVYGFETIQAANHFPWFPDEEMGSLAFQAQRAASVHWIFSLYKENDSFGTRLAKAIVLGRIRKACMTGTQGVTERSVIEAYRNLTRPVSGTSLTIKFNEKSEESIEITRVRREYIWSKQLSLSDVQIIQKGRPVPYLRLTQSGHPIDYETWFRNTLFGDLVWQDGHFGRRSVEEAQATFFVQIQGIPLGNMIFKITHAASRAGPDAHGHPPTWLHWNDQLLSAFRSGFYAYHWVWLERIGHQLNLTIDAAPPR